MIAVEASPGAGSSHFCAVCQLPQQCSVHFGGRTCKACAAFFRRTVALNVKYECGKSGDCSILFDKRMNCKCCRFKMCISVGMIPDLVRSKLGDQKLSYSDSSRSPDSSTPLSQAASSSKADFDVDETISTYTKLESDLNWRRRIYHNRVPLDQVFKGICECPFDRNCIWEYDFKQHDYRADVSFMVDYSRSYPQFHKLSEDEQNILHRYSSAVDNLLNSAWYSIKIGMQESLCICTVGYYVQMSPLPPPVEEYTGKFVLTSEDDRNRYRVVRTGNITLWSEVILPMQQLHLTFEEFSLYKALVSWQICYHRFSVESKQLCDSEKTRLMQAIIAVSSRPNVSGEERLGELLLFTSSIMCEIQRMIGTMVMITTFGMADFDPTISDIFNYKKW